MKALLLVLSGCLSLAHWLATSKLLWAGIGFPVVAIGLSLTGSPISGMRAASRWLAERALDLEVAWEMLRSAPERFWHLRERIKEAR